MNTRYTLTQMSRFRVSAGLASVYEYLRDYHLCQLEERLEWLVAKTIRGDAEVGAFSREIEQARNQWLRTRCWPYRLRLGGLLMLRRFRLARQWLAEEGTSPSAWAGGRGDEHDPAPSAAEREFCLVSGSAGALGEGDEPFWCAEGLRVLRLHAKAAAATGGLSGAYAGALSFKSVPDELLVPLRRGGEQVRFVKTREGVRVQWNLGSAEQGASGYEVPCRIRLGPVRSGPAIVGRTPEGTDLTVEAFFTAEDLASADTTAATMGDLELEELSEDWDD